MPQPLDARLRDDDALDEIEITSALMIAASNSVQQLSPAEIDQIIGVDDCQTATHG